MKIVLKNECGEFEIGGGSNPKARLLETAGLGLPGKEIQSVTFEEQSGRTTTGSRDVERTITLSIDFFGDVFEMERLYRILHKPVELQFFVGMKRRRISGRCVSSTDIETIIYHRWNKAVLQFVCDDPYFHDFVPIEAAISANEDRFPNVNTDGEWYIQLPAVATVRHSVATITNRGDTILYPVIHLQNNKTVNTLADEYGITLTNATTGKVITLNYDITAGEEVTIDLSKRKIYSSTNGNITNCISDDTVLSDFYLDIGDNVISVDSANISDNIFAVAEYSNNYVAVVI